MVKYIIIDVDGVMRDLAKGISKIKKIPMPTTAADLQDLIVNAIDEFDGKKLEKLYKNAPIFTGAKSFLDTLMETINGSEKVIILTAAGFNFASSNGTLEFWEKHGLDANLNLLTPSTESKIETIHNLYEDCEEMVIIDDYSKVLDSAPEGVKTILVDSYGLLDIEDSSKYSMVVKGIANIKIGDVLDRAL